MNAPRHSNQILILGFSPRLKKALCDVLKTRASGVVTLSPDMTLAEMRKELDLAFPHTLHLMGDYHESIRALRKWARFGVLMVSEEARQTVQVEELSALVRQDAVVYLDNGESANMRQVSEDSVYGEATAPSQACQICHAELKWYACKDERHVYDCTGCGTMQVEFVDDGARTDWLAVYQNDGAYHRARQLCGYPSFAARFVHDVSIAFGRLENAKRHLTESQQKLLDIGCSNGALAHAAMQMGFQAVGIDADKWAIDEAKKLTDCELYAADPLQFVRGSLYDVITIIDVFEHFHDPVTYLQTISEALKPDGLMVVEMPDAGATGFERMARYWTHFKPKEHAFYYTEDNFKYLLSLCNLELVDSLVPYPDRKTYYIKRKVSQ